MTTRATATTATAGTATTTTATAGTATTTTATAGTATTPHLKDVDGVRDVEVRPEPGVVGVEPEVPVVVLQLVVVSASEPPADAFAKTQGGVEPGAAAADGAADSIDDDADAVADADADADAVAVEVVRVVIAPESVVAVGIVSVVGALAVAPVALLLLDALAEGLEVAADGGHGRNSSSSYLLLLNSPSPSVLGGGEGRGAI